MNRLIGVAFFFLLVRLLTGCQKEEAPENKFIGNWKATDLPDTLIFTAKNSFERPHFYFENDHKDSYYDFYGYSFTRDSLTIQYNGPDKILVYPMSSKYRLVEDTLMIDYKSNYYPTIKKGLNKYRRMNNFSR